MKLQSLVKYIYAWSVEHSHRCKQHHLECLNIPETVNKFMWLCLVFHFSKCFSQGIYLQTAIRKLVSLAIKHCWVSLHIIKTRAYELNFDYLSYSELASAFLSNRFSRNSLK